MAVSWRSRECISRPADTIADGIAIRVPVPEALDWMYKYVDDVVTVDEPTIFDAMRTVRDTLGLMLEPSAVVGIAALLQGGSLSSGRVATIFTGSNYSPELLTALDRTTTSAAST
jgi:threonine dehydratase